MVEWFSLRKTVLSTGRQFSGGGEPKLNHGDGRILNIDTVTVWSHAWEKYREGVALQGNARL